MAITTIAVFVVIIGKVVSNCPFGWKSFENSCYLFGEEILDWFDASSTCQAHHADLVAIETPEEQTFIASILNQPGHGDRYWLDARDDVIKNVWEWASQNAKIEYFNWAPGQPDNGDEDCVEIKRDTNWHWNDKECDEHKEVRFICEMQQIGLGPGIIGK